MRRQTLAILLALGVVTLCVLTWLYLDTSREDAASAALPTEQEAALEKEGVEPDLSLPNQLSGSEPKEPESSARQVAAEASALAAGPAEGMQRIHGTVRLPDATPLDERVVVLAVERKMRLRGLVDTPGPAKMAWNPELRRTRVLVASAEVASDGSFQLDLPQEASRAHLALTGRYLFSMATTDVALPLVGDVTLTGELGAWITGKLLPPPDPSPLQADFEWIEVELGPDLSGGFNAMEMGSVAVTRKIEAQADGRFEFRGIPDPGSYGLAVKHKHLAALLRLGIDPAPGEHLEIQLQMVRGATLSGTVVDGNGAPVADARVHARHRGMLADAIGALRAGRTDEDGAFELEHVALGKIDLRAEKDGYERCTFKVEGELRDGDKLADLNLTLEFGASITGRVLYPDGAPAVGATVEASADLSKMLGGMDAMKAGRMRGGSTEVDENGRFELTGLTEGVFKLKARSTATEKENWSAVAQGIRPGDAPVELVVQKLTPLHGRVVDLDQQPIPEYRIRATRQGSGAMFGIGAERREERVSDEEGRFTLTDLSQHVWELEVAAEGRATSAVQEVTLPREEDAPELLFVLEPAAGVSGVVLDTEGSPVSGAKVSLEMDIGTRVQAMSSAGIPEVYTEAEGHFLLENLEPGSVSLVASHDGFAGSEPLPCSVVSGEVTEDVVLQLRLGGTLSGIVYDDEGDPAASRMVIVQKTPSYSAQHMLTSDAGGEFRVEHLEPGTWQVVATSNFMSEEVSDVDVDMGEFLGSMKMAMAEIVDGEETRVELGAPPADPVLLRGRVTHASGPVAEAMVTLMPEGSEGTDVMSSLKMKVTDDDGRFEVQLDHPGAYLLTVQTGISMGRQNSVEYLERVPEDTKAHDVTIELPGGRISGRVVGSDGQPLDACRVTMTVEGGMAYGSFMGGNYVEIETDAEGRYEANYLRAGSYAVAAGGVPLGGMLGGESKGGREVMSGVKLEEGQWRDSVDFHLAQSSELVGTVLDPNGTPIADASIFVRDEKGNLLERFSLITTDGAGRFSYNGLGPGRYSASARMPGLASQESALVMVSEEEPADVQLTLLEGTTVRATVIDESGEEVRAKISVLDASGRELAGMMSMSDIMQASGRGFSGEEQRIGPLPAGKYKIIATTEDGRRKAKSVTLTGQGERKVKLRLK